MWSNGGIYMSAFFSNFKPFAAYWAAFSIYIILPFFELIPVSIGWMICFVAFMCLFNFITGYIDGVKKIKWGIMLFAVQLLFCVVWKYAVKSDNSDLNYLIGFSNMTLVLFNSEIKAVNITVAVLSVVLPVLPFFCGRRFKKTDEEELIVLFQ